MNIRFLPYISLYCLITTIALLASCKNTTALSAKGYKVVPSLKKTIVDKLHNANGTGSLNFIMTTDDKVIADSWAKGNSIESIIHSELKNDTIKITGLLGVFEGFGFEIKLFGNSCEVRHFAKSESQIFKLKQGHGARNGIFVPCKNYELTLVQNPTFKKGHDVEGLVKLTSEEYYEVVDGQDQKHKMQLEVYFKTDPFF